MGEIIAQYAMEILGIIVVALVGWAATNLKNWLARKDLTSIARTVVTAVEQIYTDLHGQEKLDKALEMFAEMLQKRGIKVTDEQMTILIESALGEFNNVFSEQ